MKACEKAVQELGEGHLRPMLISSFFSLKQLGVLLLAKGGMIVHCMANHSFKFDGTNNDNPLSQAIFLEASQMELTGADF